MAWASKSAIGVGVGAAVLAAVTTLYPSPEGIHRVQAHEGTKLVAYLDPVRVPTICTGSTRDVYIGMKLTQAECDARLKSDLYTAAWTVRRVVKVPLSQNQFDSLVSFTFNVGGANLASSTLLKRVNAGDCYGAAVQFDRWTYAKGTKLPGLITRRADERMWFEQDCKLWK